MHQVLLSKLEYKKGITLVEVAIGVTLLSLTVLMSIFAMSQFIELRKETQQNTKAVYLAEEGIEILRYIRDVDWNVIGTDLSTDTRYYLHASSTHVATTTSPEVIDGKYHRGFILYDVYRDNTSDDVVASTSGSAYVDPGSREVYMSVGHDLGTSTLRTILTNILDI